MVHHLQKLRKLQQRENLRRSGGEKRQPQVREPNKRTLQRAGSHIRQQIHMAVERPTSGQHQRRLAESAKKRGHPKIDRARVHFFLGFRSRAR